MVETNESEMRRVTALVGGDETGGRLAVVEVQEVPGQELTCHLHTNEDELIYVLEGNLTFWVGDDEHRVGPGGCLFLPRGIEHGYAVTSGVARQLVMVTPAESETYLGAMNAVRSSEDLERLIAMAARYGIAITGPAPTVERGASDVTASGASMNEGSVGPLACQ